MNGVLTQRIAIIGFGEAGRVFGRDLAASGAEVSVFDSVFSVEQSRKAMLEKAQQAKVRVAADLGDAIRDAGLVISAVTASSAAKVAQGAAKFLRPGQVYMDINSVSPETKRKMETEIQSSGADFVEAVAMAPVAGKGMKVPILLGGSRAAELTSQLKALGMDTTAVSEKVGVASAIKMCRSVVMKGIAALAIESLFAARRYGAEDEVIASFQQTYPSMGWSGTFPDNLIYRAVEHANRRAAEMREAAETLKDAGMNSFMSSSTATLQDWIAQEMEDKGIDLQTMKPFSWRSFADAIASSDGQHSPSLKTVETVR